MNNNNYCSFCNKKLKTIDLLISKCKCNKFFCPKHLFYLHHNCDFNYKEEFKIIYSSNIVNLSNKIDKII